MQMCNKISTIGEIEKITEDQELQTLPNTAVNSTDSIINMCKESKIITYICDVTNCVKFFTNENELRV